MIKYPCKKCLLKASCREFCPELLNLESEKMYSIIWEDKTCPDCGETGRLPTIMTTITGIIKRCPECTHMFHLHVGCLPECERLDLNHKDLEQSVAVNSFFTKRRRSMESYD